MKILIVDDEIDICNFLSYSLKKRNFDTAYAQTLADAEKRLSADHPSILLLDNHLPDGFGMNYIEKFKRLYPEMRIIMISAYDTSADRDTALKAGADYFISKPFNLKELNETILKLS